MTLHDLANLFSLPGLSVSSMRPCFISILFMAHYTLMEYGRHPESILVNRTN